MTSAIEKFGVDDPTPDDIAVAVAEKTVAAISEDTSFSTLYSYYRDLAEELTSVYIDDVGAQGYNNAIAVELALTALLIAIAVIIIASQFSSRSEIVTTIEKTTEIFNNTVAIIEEKQEEFSDLDIDFQYFSQTSTYTTLINLYTQSLQYLFAQFYQLSAEKIITIQKNRSPIEITVTEYGTLGENDENYNLFLQSNGLTGDEILLLPAGREVVVYV